MLFPTRVRSVARACRGAATISLQEQVFAMIADADIARPPRASTGYGLHMPGDGQEAGRPEEAADG